jgi:hypothetical protein
MTEKRRAGRATDGPWQARFWATLRTIEAVFQKSGLIICLVIATFSTVVAAYAVWNVEAEARERRDATCELFERQERASIRRLTATYDYLENLPQSEYGSALTKAIVRGLDETEDDAQVAIAPVFCDEAGVGLGEKHHQDLPADRNYDDRAVKP